MTKIRIVLIDEEIEKFLPQAKSWSELFRLMNVKRTGTTHHKLKERVEYLGLDISHFRQPPGRPGNTRANYAQTLEELLANPKTKSGAIRARLIKDGIFEPKCNRCNLYEWNGLPIPLELEHIDGNSSNNTLSNFDILCCNCHAQTPTWRRGWKKNDERD